MSRLACQDLVDMLVSLGMKATYVGWQGVFKEIENQDKNTVLVYVHNNGETVILLGDKKEDHVSFKFSPSRRNIRD